MYLNVARQLVHVCKCIWLPILDLIIIVKFYEVNHPPILHDGLAHKFNPVLFHFCSQWNSEYAGIYYANKLGHHTHVVFRVFSIIILPNLSIIVIMHKPTDLYY